MGKFCNGIGIVKKINAPEILIPSLTGLKRIFKTIPKINGKTAPISSSMSTILKAILFLAFVKQHLLKIIYTNYWFLFIKGRSIIAIRGKTSGITTAIEFKNGTKIPITVKTKIPANRKLCEAFTV